MLDAYAARVDAATAALSMIAPFPPRGGEGWEWGAAHMSGQCGAVHPHPFTPLPSRERGIEFSAAKSFDALALTDDAHRLRPTLSLAAPDIALGVGAIVGTGIYTLNRRRGGGWPGRP